MFLRKDFMLAFMNGWSMSIVGPHNFAAKWFAGRARPEEVVWLIKKGKVDGVPKDIEREISQMNIRSAAGFTAYEEGSPNHPSWPAMHAASGMYFISLKYFVHWSSNSSVLFHDGFI